MKKIISIMLCAFMLLSVLSLSTFATEEEAVDNSVIDLTTNVAVAPALDGVISEGEYTYNHSTDLVASDDEIGTAGWEAPIDDKGAIYGIDYTYKGGFREVGFSFAADDDYLYVAAYANKESGSAPQYDVMILNAKGGPNYGNRGTIKADGTAEIVSGVAWNYAEIKTSETDGLYVYEGKIARSDLGLSKSELNVITRLFAADPECFVLFGVGADTMTVKLTPLADASDEPAGPSSYSIYNLAEYGYEQTHWTIPGKTENPPIVDGLVEAGEYTLEIKDMKAAEDATDDRFFCVDPEALDIESMNIYLSYDDENIYVGVEVLESETLTGEYISFRMGLDEHDFTKNISINYTHGVGTDNAYADTFLHDFIDGGISYEMAIKRTALIDYLGLEEETDINEFFLQIVVGDDRDIENHPESYPEMWFGCQVPYGFEGVASSGEAAESEGKIWGLREGSRYPHIMTLGDAPAVDTDPAEDPADTGSADTDPVDTDPTESTPTDTNTPDAEAPAKDGCGASVAAVAVALVAALGTCTVFVNKRR